MKEAPLPAASAKSAAKPAWQEAQLLIPEIYVDAPIVRGVDVQALKRGVGYDTLSQLPGTKGNCVLAAHRNVWGAEFWHLPRLKPGSTIYIQTPQKRYTYRVAFTRTVPPYDTSLLEAPPAHQKTPRLTLYTCTKPKTESRFIVVANQVRVENLPFVSTQNSGKKTATTLKTESRQQQTGAISVAAAESTD